MRPGHPIILKKHQLLVNWGNSTAQVLGERVLNPPHVVHRSVNKLLFLRSLKDTEGIYFPDWCEDIDTARKWIEGGSTVVCRTLLTSHSGNGIVVAETPEQLVKCLLYTKYVKKKKEFRVHVFNGSVIDVQEKRKRPGVESNPKIRNLANGWVYCKENIKEPDSLRETAIKVIKASNLTFGAVDIIWNEKENRCYVLEVNCAPGLEGTTIESYGVAINEYTSNQI